MPTTPEMPEIRPASSMDIPQISEVLIRSITELCREDHQGDADLLAEWTGNKSDEDIRRWLDGPHHLRVSLGEDGRIAAVGMFSDQGEILLLYVHPAQRAQGHSDALLDAMERAMRRNGLRHATLESTRVAHDFYRRRGWRDSPHAAHAPSSLTMPLVMHKELTRL